MPRGHWIIECEPGPTTVAVFKILAGTCVGFAIVVLDLAFYVSVGLKKKWVRVGTRVLGSWPSLTGFALLKEK